MDTLKDIIAIIVLTHIIDIIDLVATVFITMIGIDMIILDMEMVTVTATTITETIITALPIIIQGEMGTTTPEIEVMEGTTDQEIPEQHVPQKDQRVQVQK